jgi:hypothetical protein
MKVTRTTCRWAALGAALSVFAWARGAAGQAVQLPTFHFFSLSTTVSVPDGGDALLGGVSRSSSAWAQRGIPGLPSQPFDNVATSSATGTSNVSVSAKIHDFEAMDRALLGQDQKAAVAGRAGQLVAARPAANEPVQSIAAIRAQQAAEDAAKEREASAALERGRQLLADGKTNVAKIYLLSAVKKSSATSDVHQQALAALRSIEQASSAGKLAGH